MDDGFRPTVVERAPALRDGGYKVDIRGAATEVLKRMDLFTAARAHDTGMRHVTYVNRAGRFSLSVRNYGMRTLRYNPLKRQLIERVTRPLHDAANAIELPSYPMAPVA